MDIQDALTAFDALSQETRLRVFRLLVEYGRNGAAAGRIGEALGIPHNTLSFHLNQMSHARLVTSERAGRSIIYRANFEFFSHLLRYMVEDCCRAEFKGFAAAGDTGAFDLMGCCAPAEKGKTS